MDIKISLKNISTTELMEVINTLHINPQELHVPVEIKEDIPVKMEDIPVPEETTITLPTEKVEEIVRSLSAVQLGKLIGVTEQTVCNYVKAGLPYSMIEGKRKYSLDECKEWLKTQPNRNDSKTKRKTKQSPESKALEIKPTDSDYVIWRKKISKRIADAHKDEGKVLSQVFKYMTKTYGVCWEQVKRDFYKAEGRPCNCTKLAAHWLQTTDPTYTNMFESCLETIVKGGEK